MQYHIQMPPELPALLARLSEADKLKASTTTVRQFAPIFNRALISNSQKLAGSGMFSRGWLVSPTPQSGMLITNNAPKAIYIELPTVPHEIKPRYKKALAWLPGGTRASGGRAQNLGPGFGWLGVVVKKVWHPGTRGKRVFQETLVGQTPAIFRMLADEARKFLTGKDDAA